MSEAQSQGLSFFNDGNLISNDILSSSQSYTTSILIKQGTSAHWLTNSLVENGLLGTASLVNNELSRKTPDRSFVYYVSFLSSRGFLDKGIKKNGIDLSKMKTFRYIDLFDDLFISKIKRPHDALDEISLIFEEISQLVQKDDGKPKVLIIEGSGLLLSATNINSIQLLKQIAMLSKQCNISYIVESADLYSMLDLDGSQSNGATFKYSDFLSRLVHRSEMVVNLSPLATGRSEDVTGVLKISKGPTPYYGGIEVREKRYLYKINKESNLKFFFA